MSSFLPKRNARCRAFFSGRFFRRAGSRRRAVTVKVRLPMRYLLWSIPVLFLWGVSAATSHAANPSLFPAEEPIFLPDETTAISAETSAAPSAERPAVPSAETPAASADGDRPVLNSDAFSRSFNEAFDEVLAETAPELRFEETGENEKMEPVSDFLLTRQSDSLREMFELAIPAAVACERLPGAKARRPFLFARRDDGEYVCLVTGGYFDMTPGEILRTGRPLDAALGEDGGLFFVLRREGSSELVYSRAGNFIADPGGGLYLDWNGDRYYSEPRVTGVAPNDVLPLVRFANPEFLESDDGVFFRPTELSGFPSPIKPPHERRALITPRALENSNARLDLILLHLKRASDSSLVGTDNIK